MVTASNSHPDSFEIFAAFTAYYLVERLLRYHVSKHWHSHEFQRTLRMSRKDSAYFGILLGALISLTSFPFCASAAWEYLPSLSGRGTLSNQHLTFSAQICVTSRGVLWISELNRLDLYSSYVYHHLGSIIILLSAFRLDVLEILFLPFASLVSEIPGDLVWLWAAHREMDSRFIHNPVWEGRRKRLQAVNIWIYSLMRVPTVPAIAYSASLVKKQNESNWGTKASCAWLVWVYFSLMVYVAWVVAYLIRQSRALKGEPGMKVGDAQQIR